MLGGRHINIDVMSLDPYVSITSKTFLNSDIIYGTISSSQNLSSCIYKHKKVQ